MSLSLAAPEFGQRRLYANLGRAPGEEDNRFAIIWNPTDRQDADPQSENCGFKDHDRPKGEGGHPACPLEDRSWADSRRTASESREEMARLRSAIMANTDRNTGTDKLSGSLSRVRIFV